MTIRRHGFTLYQHDNGFRQRLPSAIIVGVSKCGTRAVNNFLSVHPDIPEGTDIMKEINFFNLHYSDGVGWYRSQMPPSRFGQTTIEKSPRYFFVDGIPEKIRKFNRTIKLIIVVCDPVLRFVSQTVQNQLNERRQHRQYIPIEDRVLTSHGNARNRSEVNHGCYYSDMVRWNNVFPLSQMYIVDGDDLRSNPYKEMVKLESFLGLRKFFTESNFYYNATKGFYCPASNGVPKCLGKNKGRVHPDMPEQVHKALFSYYKECNLPFFNLIHRTFEWFQTT